ncbi:MAG TPA: hypothetical protein VGC96_14730 [Candidatus Elarobacter sp.]
MELVTVGRGEIGIVRIGDGVEIAGLYATVPQRPSNRLLRQFPRGERDAWLSVLPPGEAFFFRRRDDPAIDDERRSRIVKNRVDS